MASDTERSTPTVIVARTPVEGREREFERWLQRLVAQARQAPGHIHSEVQAPTPAHPGEWVIIYQFATAELLDAWLRSPERAELMAQGADMVAGEARTQHVATAPHSPSVTAVSSFRVRAGHKQPFDELHGRLLQRLATFPGFLRSEVFDPVEGVQDETVVVFSFDSREHLDAWLSSPDRERLLSDLEPHIEGGRTLNVVGGFGGWFARPGMAQVKRWKQASVVLGGLLPVVLVLTALRQWLVPDVPWPLATAIQSAISIVLLTWVLMPFLTRLLSGWLSR